MRVVDAHPNMLKPLPNATVKLFSPFILSAYTKDKIEAWKARLSSVYNRGFWEGYYLGRMTGEWTENYGSQATTKKEYIGKITNYFTDLKVAEIKIETWQNFRR